MHSSANYIVIATATVMRYSRVKMCTVVSWFRGKLETSSCIFLGIVPIFCEQIFVGIDEKKQAGDSGQYEVIFGT